jgi:2'-5' RNA ligase
MRLFIAISLPDSFKEYLAVVQKQILNTGAGIRMVKPDNMHITLKFIGEASPERAEVISEALNTVKHSPFTLRSSPEIGAFPNRKNPRVIWLGLEEKTRNSMHTLFEEIEKSLERRGIPREKRAFKTHLTLGRVPDKMYWKNSFWRPILDIDIEKREYSVSSFELIQSKLLPAGAVYSTLESYRLY